MEPKTNKLVHGINDITEIVNQSDSKKLSRMNIAKHKQHTETLAWIEKNYELADGVCLPRCILYQHYLEFCQRANFSPVGPATFGKMIRQRFPKITTRRLGTRGQSIYHYCGIGIQEQSIYYKQVYNGKGLSKFSGVKIKLEGNSKRHSLNSKTGTLLPEFPIADDLNVNDEIEKKKIATFLMMYHTHCQRILDTMISANFEEVQKFLLHFWQGMPTHLLTVLSSTMVKDIVAYCDSILYKVLNDVLIPSSIQELPESLASDIKSFLHRFPVWLSNSLTVVPDGLRAIKLETMNKFTKGISRQLAFIHLAQTVRVVVGNHEISREMQKELRQLDMKSILIQLGYLSTPMKSNKYSSIVWQFLSRFLDLLQKQSPLEDYMDWIDDVLDTCVMQMIKHGQDLKSTCFDFILCWSYLIFLLLRDLTLRSSSSFGTFHLLALMFDEYIQLVLDNLQAKEMEKNLEANLSRHLKRKAEPQQMSFGEHSHWKCPRLKVSLEQANDSHHLCHYFEEKTTTSDQNLHPLNSYISENQISNRPSMNIYSEDNLNVEFLHPFEDKTFNHQNVATKEGHYSSWNLSFKEISK